ncbi:hypothetical protein R5W24_004956 [Gemmata sp. JC717]|uniref:hypothetical protein n=1 Tax=Gemmata algarum TaxID=2975278 RepID=UPI0021BABAE9|nr:hypothetical protein [Gemmata algarum]MDY3555810.1 hypothetical protein [Gemmata algarum]
MSVWVSRVVVLNAGTGAELPELEGKKDLFVGPGPHCFTADGRLLVAVCEAYRAEASPDRGEKKQVSRSYSGLVLTVWDTQTGKALKTWNENGAIVALCPTKPLLAVLEPNGVSETRLGFWDFSAEVEKK